NIIWGSAFNPDLQGKIRVSVVATGIEQTAEQVQQLSRPLNLGMSRGPVLPSASQPAQPAEPLFERKQTPAGETPSPAEPEPLELIDEEPAGDSGGLGGAPAGERSAEAAGRDPAAAEGDETEGSEEASGSPGYASLTGVQASRNAAL